VRIFKFPGTALGGGLKTYRITSAVNRPSEKHKDLPDCSGRWRPRPRVARPAGGSRTCGRQRCRRRAV